MRKRKIRRNTVTRNISTFEPLFPFFCDHRTGLAPAFCLPKNRMACRELCGTHTENRHRRPTKQITRFPSACSLHASPDANNTCGHVDKWRGLFPVQDVYVFLSSSLHPHSSLCASELAVGFAIYFAKTKCQSYYQRSMPCPSLFSLFFFPFHEAQQ